MARHAQPRADGEPLRRGVEQLCRRLIDERDHLRQLVLVLEDVHLVDDDDDLLAPVADRLEEGALGLGERPVRRRHEEHEIGARHELAGQALVLAMDRVGAWRVDDLQVAQQFDRRGHDQRAGRIVVRREGRAVANQLDARGGRGHAFLEHALAEQRVDERALAGVELADDNEHEELVELTDRGHERLEVRGSGRESDQQVA